jgi:hypothetical protein
MQNYKFERQVKKTKVNGRIPLMRRRSVMDYSAILEEEDASFENTTFHTTRCTYFFVQLIFDNYGSEIDITFFL